MSFKEWIRKNYKELDVPDLYLEIAELMFLSGKKVLVCYPRTAYKNKLQELYKEYGENREDGNVNM